MSEPHQADRGPGQSLDRMNLFATERPSPDLARSTRPKEPIECAQIIELALDRKATDIQLCVGAPAMAKVDGSYNTLGDKFSSILTPAMTNFALEYFSLGDQEHLSVMESELHRCGGVDFGFSFQGQDGRQIRLRGNAHNDINGLGISLRILPSKIIPFDQLGLPTQLAELAMRPRGLILVTGPTGSGKTTTLASLTKLRADAQDGHIITLEQPPEYLVKHSRSLVTQREIGLNVSTFAEGLRQALRQDPNVIVVGEMRDPETIQVALTAAETGHLVLSTLHTIDAPNTIHRIVDQYPEGVREQIRAQLAGALLGVCCQQLLPLADGTGRVVAYEYMEVNDAIRQQIRKAQEHQIPSSIQSGRARGMITLEENLKKLKGDSQITSEVANRANGKPLP